MCATTFVWILSGLPAFAGDPAVGGGKEPPAKLELFAKEGWYKEQEGKEQEFVGILSKVNLKGKVGFGRMNPYRLEMEADGKKTVREVYVPGKPEILDPYVGKKIKLIGKPVDMDLEGRKYAEIWPARLEVVADKAKNAKEVRSQRGDAEVRLIKIIARANWPYGSTNPDGPREGHTLVLRSAAELVAATPFKNRDALPEVVEKQATAELATMLKVDGIDWKKQMLTVVTAGVKGTGGFSVDIASIGVGDKMLTVTWKLNTPKGAVTQAFTHPGQVVLVEQVEGKAKFVQEAGKGAKGPRDVDPSKSPARPADPSDLPAQPAVRFDSPARPASDGEEKPAQKTRELKIIGQTPTRVGAGSATIRSAKELAAATGEKDEDAASARLAKALKVESIDWAKQMIIVVSGGVQRTGGYSVTVNKLEVGDKVLTVHWKLNTPKPGQPVTQAITHPAQTILVERFEGEVRFDPAPPKGKGLGRE